MTPLLVDIERRAWEAGAALDGPTVALATAHVLDAVGCVIGAGGSRMAGILRRFTDGLGTEGESLLTGVLRDATLVHVEEFDAIHTPAAVCPAGVSVIPALALGARTHASGDTLLAAVVAGYEAIIETATAFDAARLYVHRWWPSAVFGAIGSAMTASVLLGLGEEERQAALALAGASVGGVLSAVDLREGHYLLYGRAAAAGVDAALLASAGARGDVRVLDDAASVALQQPPMLAERAPAPRIAECTLKPYPIARPLHPAVDAFEALRAEHGFTAEDIDAVDVRLPAPVTRVTNELTKPGTTVEAVCSPSYVLHAVLRGDVDDPRTYRQDALDAAAPPSFDVTVGASDELDALYPANWPAAITVRLRSGATLGRMVPDGRGAPSVPLAWEDVVAKFRRQAAGELDDAATEGCIDRIEGLQALTDIAGLRALLTHHKETPS